MIGAGHILIGLKALFLCESGHKGEVPFPSVFERKVTI